MKNLKFISINVCLIFSCYLQAQCDLEVNKDGFAGTKHVETSYEWLSQSGSTYVSSKISSFYDGTPHIQLVVRFFGLEHFYIDKEHEVIFHFNDRDPIKKNNFLRKGAKNSKEGTYRSVVYTIPIDEELKNIFLKPKNECALSKIEFTHSLGNGESKVKKKYKNTLGDQTKCVYEVSMDWPKK